jgi:hypothetical protein
MSEYEAKLKYGTDNLGSGTANATTYLRGDLTWNVVATPVDLSSIEDSTIMVAWDTYADDRTFDDIAIDNFADTTGIETGSSSGYTASAGYVSPIASQNMVLVSQEWEASVNDPTAAYCVLNLEPVDAITLDTDLKAYISIDDAANYEQITGLAIYRTIGSNIFIRGDITGITARTDKTIRLKVTGLNNGSNTKRFKLHAWALGVKY